MADKPSRALVLYGDGLARFIEPSHTHLHALASLANCGFLTLPNAPSSESEDDRIVREFAVLMDASECNLNKSKKCWIDAEYGHEPSLTPSMSDRFMGMKAALLSNNSNLKSFGEKLGLTVLQSNELCENSRSLRELPVDDMASGLLKLLGFEEGKTQEASQCDLVVLHIGAGEETKAMVSDVEFINALAGRIISIDQPGSDISSRLYLSLVMSYGCISEADNPKLSVLIPKNEDSLLSALVPRQSYTMRGENPREDVRHYGPMLVAQWQYAVTRKDMAEKFSFEEFKEHGGNLSIPADRLIYEIAFKLWKAPKYGA